MDASLQDLVVCLAVWSVPTALLGVVGLFGDRIGKRAETPVGRATLKAGEGA